MTRYLLDTNILIDISKGRQPSLAFVLALAAHGHELCISAVILAEFYAGIRRGTSSVIDQLLDSLTFWDVTRSIALRAGAYRYASARTGVTLSSADTLIAATAGEHAAIVVTRNLKDFPMTDIRVVAPA